MFFLSTGPLCAGLFYVNLLEAALSFITDSFYKLFEPLKSTVSRNAQVEPDEDIRAWFEQRASGRGRRPILEVGGDLAESGVVAIPEEVAHPAL